MSKRASNKSTTISKSLRYKYVSLISVNCNLLWRARVVVSGTQVKSISKTFPHSEDGEKKAAIWVDKKLLEYGKKPVNVLTLKN